MTDDDASERRIDAGRGPGVGDPGPGSNKDSASGPRRPGVSRRTVLTGAAIGGGAIVAAGMGVMGVRSATNGVFNAGAGAPYELWQDVRRLTGVEAVVAAGVLAANPHNIQPWRFRITGSRIDVYSDVSRSMPVNDPDRRERLTGLGCAVENMLVAARAQGLTGRLITASGEWPGPVATIMLAPGPAATKDETTLAAQIPRRHTNRGPYTAQHVDLTRLRPLDVGGLAEVIWIDRPPAKEALGALYVDATRAITSDPEMSKEAFSWFRNDRVDIDTHRDGLTLDCQGLDGLTLFFAKLLPAQSRASGDAFWVKSTRDVHTATAAAYGIIRASDPESVASRIAAGRLLQHTHLAATEHGIGLQPMNQIGERSARDRATGRGTAFADRWTEAIGFPSDDVVVSFRVGYPQRDAQPSPRRPLHNVMTT